MRSTDITLELIDSDTNRRERFRRTLDEAGWSFDVTEGSLEHTPNTSDESTGEIVHLCGWDARGEDDLRAATEARPNEIWVVYDVPQERVAEIDSGWNGVLDVLTDAEMTARSLRPLRKHIEAECRWRSMLADSHATYSSLVENVPFCVLRKDAEGLVTFVNEHYCQFTGVSREEMIGKTDYDMFSREMADKYRADDQKVMDSGELFAGVEEHEQGSSLRHVEVIKTPLLDGRGQRVGVQVIFWDVTDRVRAEQSLRTSEARAQAVFNAALDCVITMNEEGKILDFNPAAERTFGYNKEEVINQDLDEFLFPPDLSRREEENRDRYRSEGEAGSLIGQRTEFLARRKNGQEFVAEMAMQPIPLDDECGFTIFLRDVTVRKAAEKALQSEKALLQALMDNVPDVIYFKDLDSRFTRINRALTRKFGLDHPEDAVDKSDFDFFSEEFARQARRQEMQVMQSLEPVIGAEEHAVWPDGNSAWMRVTKLPLLDEHGHVVGCFGISSDISQQIEHQQVLEEARDAAEAANRAKSDFLAVMSHEIRTPMNAIIGMTELLLDTRLEAVQREYLTMVLDSGESLLALINDILDFSKIEAGKFDLDAVAFDPAEQLADTVKTLALRAHRKKLELICDVEPDLPEGVVGDSSRIRQIIVNLTGNAIKFTEEGEVVVSLYRESAPSQGDGPPVHMLHYSVSDSGIGIAEDQLGRIFHAFEQADMSINRRYGGTGLGLAISARLATLMGGRTWVESELGRGSTFHVVIPLSEATEPIPSHRPRATQRIVGTRVMIVDDNATNLRILEEMLQNWGMRPVCASSAESALQLLRAMRSSGEEIPLIISDVNMPDVDGFEMASRIRQDATLDSSLIMMLTSGDRPGDVGRCKDVAANAYLMKPIKQSELFDSIVQTLGVTEAEPETPTVARTSPATTMPHLRILLAEDRPANQKLAVGLLEKWGHQVSVANNGLEVLSEIENRYRDYDLILMDVQMPELDGLEATAAVRDWEQPYGTHIPIIAMTANAMRGDREECLDAGMDGYIAKPVRANELRDTLLMFFADQVSADGTPDESSPPDESELMTPADSDAEASGEVSAESAQDLRLDWSAARDAVGGDEDLLRGVLEAFLEELPELRAGLRSSYEKQDGKEFRRFGHSIKGGLRLFGQPVGYAAALAAEEVGRDEKWDAAEEVIRRVEEDTGAVEAAVREAITQDNLPR